MHNYRIIIFTRILINVSVWSLWVLLGSLATNSTSVSPGGRKGYHSCCKRANLWLKFLEDKVVHLQAGEITRCLTAEGYWRQHSYPEFSSRASDLWELATLFGGITVTSPRARYLFPVCPTLIPTAGACHFQVISLRSCTEMTDSKVKALRTTHGSSQGTHDAAVASWHPPSSWDLDSIPLYLQSPRKEWNLGGHYPSY